MRKLLLFALLLCPQICDAARLFVAASSDKITVPSATRWVNQISASVWVYPTTLPGAAASMDILSDTNGAGRIAHVFMLYNPSGTQRIYFEYNSPAVGSYVDCYADVTLSTGAWSHVAWAFDNAASPDTCSIWVNGTSQSTTITPGTSNGVPESGSGGNARAGSRHWSTEVSFFDGRIAEAAWWIDVAVLKQGEVTALARGERADKVRLSPTRYYPLEGWQTTEPDYGTGHAGSTSITGTSRANHPPVVPR